MTEGAQETYKKNFLSNVSTIINFADTIEVTPKTLNAIFDNLADEFKPPKKMQEYGLNVAGDAGGHLATNQSVEYIYRISRDDDYYVEVAKNRLVFVTQKYSNYQAFELFYKPILNSFIDKYEIKTVNRVGLRYINNITLSDSNVFEWFDYLDPSLIQSIKFVNNKDTIRRAMHNLFIAHDEDTLLNFNYGLFNKSFPSKMLEKNFILDYECFTPYGIASKEIIQTLNSYNDILTAIFEASIRDKLREEMRKDD